MCLAIPGKIKTLDEATRHAVVDIAGVQRQVNVDLLRDETLAEGDWVLIHVGFAMSKISAQQADEQMKLLQMLGEADDALDEVKGYSFGDDS